MSVQLKYGGVVWEGTAAEFNADNRIWNHNELLFTEDTATLRKGNGSDKYTDLPDIGGQPGEGTTATWGDITGTLTSQTDLQDALTAIQNDSVQVGGQAPSESLVLGTTNDQTVNIETNGDPRITINSIGNVGIGITDPQAPLAVAGAITVQAGAVQTVWDPTSGTSLITGTISNHPVNFVANAVNLLTLDTDVTISSDLEMTGDLTVLPFGGDGIVISGSPGGGVPSITTVGANANISLSIAPKGTAGVEIENSLTLNLSENASFIINDSTPQPIFTANANGIGLEVPFFAVRHTTAERPTLNPTDAGAQIYDTTLNRPIWWNGTDWLSYTGIALGDSTAGALPELVSDFNSLLLILRNAGLIAT